MSNFLIVCLFVILGLITGFLVTIFGKIREILLELDVLDVIKFGVKDVIAQDAILIRENLTSLENTVTEQNEKYIDILSKILNADETLGKELTNNLNALLDVVKERDKTTTDIIHKIAEHAAEVSSDMKINDKRWEMISDYFKYVLGVNAYENNSPPDEEG